ncbi:MAG: CRISPR-associated protein, partial [Spirochaetes bacterium]|nr:CRISPR-associated protein [Spirochaetota bacterium]
MIHAMRQISLDYIYDELYESKENIGTKVEDLESWYLKFRKKDPGKLFPFLIEDIGKIEKLYTVIPDLKEKDTVNLIVSDIKEEHKQLLPFVKPSGSQSSPVGPVIKRSYIGNKAGPSGKIVKTAYTVWGKIADSNIEVSS